MDEFFSDPSMWIPALIFSVVVVFARSFISEAAKSSWNWVIKRRSTSEPLESKPSPAPAPQSAAARARAAAGLPRKEVEIRRYVERFFTKKQIANLKPASVPEYKVEIKKADGFIKYKDPGGYEIFEYASGPERDKTWLMVLDI